MDQTLDAPKPMTSLPSHLLNGSFHQTHHSSPLRKRTSVNARERDKLTASIISSNSRRQPIDLDTNDQFIPGKSHDREEKEEAEQIHPNLDVAARDPRDEDSRAPPPVASRPASPYTQNPPIDFDGLSWPSYSSITPCRSL